MPGSLFPRSSSLEPDGPDGDRRVHFLFDVPSPAHPSRSPLGATEDETEAGPSRINAAADTSAESADPYQTSLDQYLSPWRTRSVSSVKDAVQRFNTTEGAEADFSLLLPSPHSSPVKAVARSHSDAEPSQKASSGSAVPTMASRKGKERARDETDCDLAFIVGESSGRVHAKERELDAAREEEREHQRHSSGDHNSQAASGERERDKQRIKALEEEVKRLKKEVRKFSVTYLHTQV
ncbi:hypothetical protein PAXRUDRAFT_296740 [Paxillus rubicundulus Ve08.2h10]|uniref:Uncharacterized protein n=1 Tax=Paxillus rubicundulus Ve08.2h10 TaxID=930991 RepID=A0A0D0EAF7_9AGAM|nr:hypothetical protein PAXRUDRAFT_296740 [Paxillus rubicundulus Ve08.2h10]